MNSIIDRAANITPGAAIGLVSGALRFDDTVATDNVPVYAVWLKMTIDQRKLALADWIRAEIYAQTGSAP